MEKKPKLNKRQKGLVWGIAIWMLSRIVYIPLVLGRSLFDGAELFKTVGVIFFCLILIYLVKDKRA